MKDSLDIGSMTDKELDAYLDQEKKRAGSFLKRVDEGLDATNIIVDDFDIVADQIEQAGRALGVSGSAITRGIIKLGRHIYRSQKVG